MSNAGKAKQLLMSSTPKCFALYSHNNRAEHVFAAWQQRGKYYNCHRYLPHSKSWLGSATCATQINMHQYLSFLASSKQELGFVQNILCLKKIFMAQRFRTTPVFLERINCPRDASLLSSCTGSGAVAAGRTAQIASSRLDQNCS